MERLQEILQKHDPIALECEGQYATEATRVARLLKKPFDVQGLGTALYQLFVQEYEVGTRYSGKKGVIAPGAAGNPKQYEAIAKDILSNL